MSDHAKVITFETLSGDSMHRVDIFDKTAQALADLFLPPDGTQISGADLQAAVERLVEATNAVKRLERES
jgi:hypothetical protein